MKSNYADILASLNNTISDLCYSISAMLFSSESRMNKSLGDISLRCNVRHILRSKFNQCHLL